MRAQNTVRLLPNEVALGVTLLIALVWASSSSTSAEPSSTRPGASSKAKDRTGLKDKHSDVVRILREPERMANEGALLDKYFNEYFLPQFVAADAEEQEYDYYPSLRGRLFKHYFNPAKGEARVRLTKLTYTKMKEILADKKQPKAAHVNAMLVLGGLSEQESADALKDLVAAIKSRDTKDELKIAALVGLERTAAVKIPAERRDEISQLMLNLVSEAKPPAARSAAVHTWMRRGAGQVLASLGSPGKGNNVLKAFEAIMADPKSPLTLRCETAQFIGKLKYTPAAKVDFQRLANSLARQAADIYNQELKDATQANRAPSRQLIVYSLNSSIDGLDGLQAVAKETPSGEFIDNVRKKLKAMTSALDSADLEDSAVPEQLNDKIKELLTVLAAKANTQVAERKEKAPEPKQ